MNSTTTKCNSPTSLTGILMLFKKTFFKKYIFKASNLNFNWESWHIFKTFKKN